MELKRIECEFSVCKVADFGAVERYGPYCFIARTEEENSLVCPTGQVPERTLERSDGWKAFRIQGVLDFSLVGVLAKIAALLAEHRISIFAVSTYNTDYILTRKEQYAKALELLAGAGYTVV